LVKFVEETSMILFKLYNMRIFKFILIFTLINSIAMLVSAQKWMKSPYLNKTKSEANFYDIQKAFNKYYSEIKDKKKKGTGFKQFKRWEYRMQPKVYPTGTLPEPLKYWKEYQKFLSENDTKAGSPWYPLGMTSWTEFVEGGNPGNGRLNVVTVDPKNRNVIYVGAPEGGVWKSNDGGLTWNTTFDFMPRIGVSSIAIHPYNSDIIYAGTGDRDAFDCKSIGLLKSTDAGNTWVQTGFHPTSPDYNNVNKILINPLNPNNILIATYYGVYRSKNSGNSWVQVYNGEIKNLKYRPNDTSVVYGCSNVFIRSENSGASFTEVIQFPPDNSRIEIDVTKSNPSVVYALVGKSDNTFEGLYKSSDNGQTFTQNSSTPNILGYDPLGNDNSGQAWYDLAIAASPDNENDIYTGGVNIWKSTDAGQNWQICTEWYTGSGYNYIHCDIHYMQFYGDTLFVGSDGGIFYTPDLTNSWVDLSAGLGITQFYSFGQSEVETGMVIGGTQDVGSNLLRNGIWTHVLGGDGMECMIDSDNPDIFYTTYYYGAILKTEDGGYNFVDITPPGAEGGWVTPYQMSKNNPQHIIGGYKDVYETTDGGLTWNTISTNLTDSNNISNIAMGGVLSNYIYASFDDKLYITKDHGVIWDTVTPFTGYSISGIAVDNINPERIWICLSSYSGNRVLFSQNGGTSFINITSNLSGVGFNCITFDEKPNNGLYLGTEVGVFYRNDSIGHWISINQDLPVVSVTKIDINHTLHKIRASTYGRGIWETQEYTPSGITKSEFENNISIYPNPATDQIIIDFNLNSVKEINLTLHNIIGKTISKAIISNTLKNKYIINIYDLVSGTYFIKIQSGNDQFVKKISIIH
jgi:photosystem II stability/assembly factor-like uncharacterized protein